MEAEKLDYVKLGKRVRQQRKLAELTQEQLAERAGISLPFLGHIERGTRKASLDTLVRLANALEVSADLLLQDSLAANRSEESAFSPAVSRILHDLATELARDSYLQKKPDPEP